MKVVLLVAALAAIPPAASALPLLTGNLLTAGPGIISTTGCAGGAAFCVATPTGQTGINGSAGTLNDFNPFDSGGTATLTFDPFTSATVGTTSPVFTISVNNSTVGIDTLEFIATGYSGLQGPQANCTLNCTPTGSVDLTGYLTDTAHEFANTGATLDFSENGTELSFTEDVVVAVTPEPGSLLLLGTGLVGAAGLMVYRRREAA